MSVFYHFFRGGDIKKFLGYGKNGSDYYDWSNQQLQAALVADNGSNPMTTFRSTWYEQRNWGCYYAMEALSMSSETSDQNLYKNIMKQWDIITNVVSPLDDGNTNWIKVTDPTQTFTVTSSYNDVKYEIQFDTTNSGALNKLLNTKTNVNYAGNDNLLGEFIYATYTETDFNNFIESYSYSLPPKSYVPGDFGKSGLDENANPEHQYISATFNDLYQASDNKNKFLVEMNFGKNQTMLQTKYGAPQNVYQLIDFSNNRSTFTSDIVWVNKTATRIPEDYFYRFNPMNCDNWIVDKFGEMIDISNVVLNGTMHMHGTTGNVSCSINKGNDMFSIESVDVALSTFIPKSEKEYSPFPVPFVDSDEVSGTAFVLYDNTWGTNYPVWYPFDPQQPNSTFRFNVYV